MGHISAEGSLQINEGTADQLLPNLPWLIFQIWTKTEPRESERAVGAER